MNNLNIKDLLFFQAVQAIDSGDINVLETLVNSNPYLIKNRLVTNEEGYFIDPYLLWFVADNPIRVEKLAANIVEITQLLIAAVKREAPDTCQMQLDYTLGLVATGRIPRECGAQIAMMDALIDAGAKPGGGMGAFAHGNIEAAQHLINRGGKLTLPAAVCLERMDDIVRMAPGASSAERLAALTAAAFFGKVDMIKLLLDMGADPNGYPEKNSGFHHHATPLHQAVYSGNLEAVKLLVEAGAKLDMPDKIYDGTPLGWAIHMQTDANNEHAINNYKQIEAYLKQQI